MTPRLRDDVRIRAGVTAAQWLRLAAAGLAACSSSGWIEALAADAAGDPRGGGRASCSG